MILLALQWLAKWSRTSYRHSGAGLRAAGSSVQGNPFVYGVLRLLDQSDGLVNSHYPSENGKYPIHQEVFDSFSPAVNGIS